MRVRRADERVVEELLREKQQVELTVSGLRQQSQHVTRRRTPVLGVLAVRHDRERLAEVLLVQAHHLARSISHTVVALHDERGLVLEEAVVHVCRRHAAALRRSHADVLVERLEPEADDAVLEDVRGGGGAAALEPVAVLPRERELSLIAAERPPLLESHPRDLRLVADDLETQRNLVVGELAAVVIPGERLVHAVRQTELHGARAVEADVGEQRHGVVGARPELASDGAPLELAVRQQAEEVRAQHIGAVGPVGDGNGKREWRTLVAGVVGEGHETALVLMDGSCGNSGDKDAQIESCHG